MSGAYVSKTEDCTVAGFRWVSLKRLQYVDAKGHKRTWEMAERIQRRTATEDPAPANGVGVVAIISTALEKDNDHIVLGACVPAWGAGFDLRTPPRLLLCVI